MIKEVKGGYQVFSEDGKKPLSAVYDDKAEAYKRLKQVEYFKNKGGKE